MAFFSTITGQFSYFSQQVGEPMWRGKNVLDFGGNIGNILRDPLSTIDQERYWCLDVDKASLEKGRKAYSKAHWIFYNRYCFFFNPNGVPHLPLPDMKQDFDYVIAFSVFTNTTESDMLELVGQLEGALARNGTLAFTFIDPYYFPWPGRYKGNNLQWRLELERERGNISAAEVESLAKSAQHANWFILVNGGDLYIESEDIKPCEPKRQRTCHAFHTEGYMKKLFPHAIVLPPVDNQMQHCCVIRNHERSRRRR